MVRASLINITARYNLTIFHIADKQEGMPELPEVECARRLLDEHCVGAKICAVNALEAGGGLRDGQFDDVVICEVRCLD